MTHRGTSRRVMDHPNPAHSPLAERKKELKKYILLEETAYLLRSPKNAARLVQAIEEIEAGKAKERQLLE